MHNIIVTLVLLLLLLTSSTRAQESFYIVTVPARLQRNPWLMDEFFKSMEKWGIQEWGPYNVSMGEYLISMKAEQHRDQGRNLQREGSVTRLHVPKVNFDNFSNKIIAYTLLQKPTLKDFLSFNIPGVKTNYVGKGKKRNIVIFTFNDTRFVNLTAKQIAQSNKALWVDFVAPKRLHNFHALQVALTGRDYGKKVEDIKTYLPLQTGRGTIITIVDTGLDMKHCYFAQETEPIKLTLTANNADNIVHQVSSLPPPPPGTKVLAYFAVELEEGDQIYRSDFTDEKDGHGTHVSGSAAGGRSSKTCHLPEIPSDAKIIFFDVANTFANDSSSGNLLVPPSILPIFEIAYAMGSRIITNSWGSKTNAMYTYLDYEVDLFVQEHPDVVILFAAGNSGEQMGTISSPATAKNTLSIGASYNSYESFLFNAMTEENIWEGGWRRYDVNDVLEKKTAYGFNNLCHFSSRGPTRDGRMKPECVFPGCNIVSSRANVVEGEESPFLVMDGTSMATPIAAHSASLIVERLQSFYRIYAPSTALIWGIMLSSTTHLTGSSQRWRFNNATKKLQIPNVNRTKLTYFDEGYGRVDLKEFMQGNLIWKENVILEAYSKPQVFCARSKEASLENVVTVSWVDPPLLNFGAEKALVHDVDMRVVHFDEEGNALSVSFPNGLEEADRVNNKEQIRISTLRNEILRISIGIHGSLSEKFQLVSLVLNGPLEFVTCAAMCDPNDVPYECSGGVFSCTTNGVFNGTCEAAATLNNSNLTMNRKEERVLHVTKAARGSENTISPILVAFFTVLSLLVMVVVTIIYVDYYKPRWSV